MAVAPKTSNEWHLHIAIADAGLDRREPPWYGPWNIVLRDFIFLSFCQPPYMTITYPQFPVSKYVDANDADDEDDEFEIKSDDEDNYDECMQLSQSLPGTPRSAAPSPDVIRGSRSLLLATPPRIHDNPPRSCPKIRTTRIPDFVQRLFTIACNSDGTSGIQSSRIILLVEIKKSTQIPEMVHFSSILKQTDHQARHTFCSSPEIQELGVILAIGPFWKYVEYNRQDFRQSPSFSEKKDATYANTPTPPPALLMRDYEPFLTLTGGVGFLRLESINSNRALHVVRERLQELNVPAVSYFLVWLCQ